MGEQLATTYRYHVWANNKVFTRLKEVPKEVLEKEIQSVFPTIMAALRHIYVTDLVWLNVLEEHPFNEIVALIKSRSEAVNTMDLTDLQHAYNHISAQYEQLLASLDYKDKAMTCNHPQFGKLETSISELIQHVVNHGTYHRGNITAMLRQLGYAGASTDYIFYLYDKSKNV